MRAAFPVEATFGFSVPAETEREPRNWHVQPRRRAQPPPARGGGIMKG